MTHTPPPWTATPAPAILGHPDGTWLLTGPSDDHGESHTIAVVHPCDDGTHPDRAWHDAQHVAECVNRAGAPSPRFAITVLAATGNGGNTADTYHTDIGYSCSMGRHNLTVHLVNGADTDGPVRSAQYRHPLRTVIRPSDQSSR